MNIELSPNVFFHVANTFSLVNVKLEIHKPTALFKRV